MLGMCCDGSFTDYQCILSTENAMPAFDHDSFRSFNLFFALLGPQSTLDKTTSSFAFMVCVYGSTKLHINVSIWIVNLEWWVKARQQLTICVCCIMIHIVKWKTVLMHSPSIALAGRITCKLSKKPRKNNPTSSLTAVEGNIIFQKKKRWKNENKMQKQGPMIQWSCSLITADAPLQMRTLAQKASLGTHDLRIPWMHGKTYGWQMSDTRHHHGDSALKPFLCWGWQPAIRSVLTTPMSMSLILSVAAGNRSGKMCGPILS